MSQVYQLDYTGSEINNKLGKIDGLVEVDERLATELVDVRTGSDGTTYESAGVAVRSQVDELHNIVDTIYLQFFDFNTNANKLAFLRVDGGLRDHDSYKCTDFLPVNSGDKIKYKLRMPTNLALICFYTSTDVSSFVSYIGGTGVLQEGEFEVPDNGYIIACTEKAYSASSYLYKDKTPELIETINKEERKRVEKFETKCFSLYGADYKSGFINVGGVFREHAAYRTTEPIFVESGTKINYRLQHGSAAPIIVLSKDFDRTEILNTVLGDTTVQEGEYEVLNDGYISFIFSQSYTNGYVAFANTVPDSVKSSVMVYFPLRYGISYSIFPIKSSYFRCIIASSSRRSCTSFRSSLKSILLISLSDIQITTLLCKYF